MLFGFPAWMAEPARSFSVIDLVNETTVDGVEKKGMVVLLADAQAKYADLTFWKLLVKSYQTGCPETFDLSFLQNYNEILL